jgi:glycine/D-amino acid oxidase-like deaminating enzyme
MGERQRVAVVGSGIAGLSAAYHIAKHGGDRVDVTLFEKVLVCVRACVRALNAELVVVCMQSLASPPTYTSARAGTHSRGMALANGTCRVCRETLVAAHASACPQLQCGGG